MLAISPRRSRPGRRYSGTEHPDDLVVFALRSISLFASSRRLAWHLGPELFRSPAAQMLAGCLLTGEPLPQDPGGRHGPEMRRLIAGIASATVPSRDDPEWGLHMVRLLAEREHLPILAATLRWAADAVLAGVPPWFVLRRVVEAFAAAMGTRPLDARLLAGGRREWA